MSASYFVFPNNLPCREFVDEAYEKGRETVSKMKPQEIDRPLKKHGAESTIHIIDPTLFDLV